MHVLFLCRGNICRSPTAEAVFRKMVRDRNLPHTCESAGTGDWHVGEDAHPPSKAMAEKHGYPMAHRARVTTRKMLDDADLITVPDMIVVGELAQQQPKALFAHKLFFLRGFAPDTGAHAVLEDPYFSGNYEKVLREVEAACEGLLAKLNTPSLWPIPAAIDPA